MIYSLSILGKNNLRFLASNFLIFVLNRFAMLHIFISSNDFEWIFVLKVA